VLCFRDIAVLTIITFSNLNYQMWAYCKKCRQF